MFNETGYSLVFPRQNSAYLEKVIFDLKQQGELILIQSSNQKGKDLYQVYELLSGAFLGVVLWESLQEKEGSIFIGEDILIAVADQDDFSPLLLHAVLDGVYVRWDQQTKQIQRFPTGASSLSKPQDMSFHAFICEVAIALSRQIDELNSSSPSPKNLFELPDRDALQRTVEYWGTQEINERTADQLLPAPEIQGIPDKAVLEFSRSLYYSIFGEGAIFSSSEPSSLSFLSESRAIRQINRAEVLARIALAVEPMISLSSSSSRSNPHESP